MSTEPAIKTRTVEFALPVSWEVVEHLRAMNEEVWSALIERAELLARRAVEKAYGSIAVADCSFRARFYTQTTRGMMPADFTEYCQSGRGAKVEAKDMVGTLTHIPTHLSFEVCLRFVRHKDEKRLKRDMNRQCRAQGLHTAKEWLAIAQRSPVGPLVQERHQRAVRDLLRCDPNTFIAGDADVALRQLYRKRTPVLIAEASVN